MTTRRRPIACGLVALLVSGALAASAPGAAFAQAQAPPASGPMREPGMHGGMGRGDGELWLMIRAANLSTEQQAKVRDILSAHRSAVRPLVDQLRQTQQELGAKLLAPGQVQVADLQPLLQRIGQLRDQLALDSAQAAIEVRAVLTPEQLARAAQAKERLRQLREEMRQLTQPAQP